MPEEQLIFAGERPFLLRGHWLSRRNPRLRIATLPFSFSGLLAGREGVQAVLNPGPQAGSCLALTNGQSSLRVTALPFSLSEGAL